MSAVFNETVNIVEPDEGLDGETYVHVYTIFQKMNGKEIYCLKKEEASNSKQNSQNRF